MRGAVIGTIMPWTGGISEIPDGWIICDGTTPDASDYPLLVQVIGDTYNAGSSNLGGAFPAYTGQFVLPSLLEGKTLMDIEGNHFDAALGTGDAIDTDSDARNLIEPFIGDNTDNGIPSVFNDVRTDVEFTLNDRNGYSGNVSGNTIIDGEGEKVVFVGGRKLGHQHIRGHSHPGVYQTLQEGDRQKPGLGVIPYDNITAQFNYASIDERNIVLGIGGGDQRVDTLRLGLKWFKENVQLIDNSTWGSFGSFSGAGSGQPGRTVMGTISENPPVNLSPLKVRQTGIANQSEYTYEQMQGGDTIQYGLFGQNYTIPQGLRNFYTDALGSGNFGTFTSNIGDDWLDNSIEAHTHDPFSVIYDQNSLKPQSRLTADVNIPVTTILDNVTNVGALEISMNTSQPSLTILYIIRAY